MPPFEYQILKMPVNRQEFYSYFLRCFGWEVQGMQENVDKVQSMSFGTNHNFGHGTFSANTHSIPRINTAYTHGNTWNSNSGTQSQFETTTMHTVLTVTYFRDVNMPNHDRLAQLEGYCWPHVKNYLARLDKGEADNLNWTDWQWYAWLSKHAQNLMRAGIEHLPPATARFESLRADHNPALGSVTFHLGLAIDRRKDLNCQAIVCFLDENDRPLADTDGTFADRHGHVATTGFLKPTFDSARLGDVAISIPYDSLHLSRRKATVKYYAAVLDLSTDKPIARTDTRAFSYSRSFFGKVQVEELVTGPIMTTGNKAASASGATSPAAAAAPAAATLPAAVAPPAERLAPAATPVAATKMVEPERIAAPPRSSPAAKSAAPVAPVAARPGLPPAKATIGDIHVVHNITVENEPGMQIDVDLTVRGRKSVPVKIWAAFEDAGGNALTEKNGRFSSSSGHVAAVSMFTPDKDECSCDALALLMPYSELHLHDGKWSLKFYVAVCDEAGKAPLAKSKKLRFHFTQKGQARSGSDVVTKAPASGLPRER